MGWKSVFWISCCFVVCTLAFHQGDEKPVYMCDPSNCENSQIYCRGRILEAVNYHALFNDSKEFVDMPIKFTPDQVIENFTRIFGSQTVEDMNREKLDFFVQNHFSKAGLELQNCVPDGWTETPEKLNKIVDPKLRKWAFQLNAIWKQLCKQMDPAVAKNPSQYSLLPVANKFIAPGGRFRESYYWDAYWIVKGLIASEMYEAAAQMLLNYRDYVKTYGFIPNGGRVYYLQRSQPPLYTPMVYELYQATKNTSIVADHIDTMKTELEWWNKNHRVNVVINGTPLSPYRYYAGSNTPRPESYKEDIATANATCNKNNSALWRNLATAAESGMDFSTRWFVPKDTHLTSIETTNVVPVDLNSIICWNLDILSYFFEEVIPDPDQSAAYRTEYIKQRALVQKIFFNETLNSWFDYNLKLEQQNPTFYINNAIPLFTNCYNILDESKAIGVFEFFNKSGAFNYSNGIPVSLITSSQQWDFPNGWANLNHMAIEGFRKAPSPAAQDFAYQIASKWVLGNFHVFNATNGHMWEKYDVVGTIPAPGSGGEYNVQLGFGWTNGVILDLLVTYGDRLSTETGNNIEGRCSVAAFQSELSIALFVLSLLTYA